MGRRYRCCAPRQRRPFESSRCRCAVPRRPQIGDDLAAVRDWVAALDAGRRDDQPLQPGVEISRRRQIGRNDYPSGRSCPRIDQAWALLGVAASGSSFRRVLALARPPSRGAGMGRSSIRIALSTSHGEMPRLIAAYDGSTLTVRSDAIYARSARPGSIPSSPRGIGRVLGGMLDVSSSPSGFLSAWASGPNPSLVRLRPSPSLGLPAPRSPSSRCAPRSWPS